MNETCPVCGYLMAKPARDFNICPCCGTEFGYDDRRRSHEELRARWIANGAPWFSRATRRPAGWDAWSQLWRAGYVPFRVVSVAGPAPTFGELSFMRERLAVS
jgi:hypothetical protein